MDSQSFTARRSAASSLPYLPLPPPGDLSSMHKYPPYAPTTTAQTVASVLTPPVGLSTDLSPLASSSNSGSSGSSSGGIAPYNPSSFWQGSQSQNYAFSGSAPPPMPSSFSQNPLYLNRSSAYPSQSMSYSGRSTSSPTAAEGLPAPPYEINLPPFATSSSSSGGSGLPTLAPQQQQQQMNNLMMNSQQPASQNPQHGPSGPDNYGGRPPPTPTYNYPNSSTSQQSSYPGYSQPTPVSQSPLSAGTSQARISPASGQNPSSMPPPQNQYAPRPYGYPLPAMSGPIMSNMHAPGSQLQLVNNMSPMGYPQHSGMQQHPSSMYGHAPIGGPSANPLNDRPFKCDQCPQSFNRNHDLKRHKRIHLAVKPFPCNHCDKSFSRKDALKRHILVKGCGKAGGGAANGSQSPVDKSEVMSDSADDSPELPRKEL